MAKSKKKSGLVKIILAVLVLLIAGAAFVAYDFYKKIYKPNIKLSTGQDYTFIYIPTGANFETVIKLLTDENLLSNRASFEWLAQTKGYVNNVKPGRYRIKRNMSNNELINHLKAGLQEPVQLSLHNIRTKKQLINRVSIKLEASADELNKLLNDDNYLSQNFGLNKHTILTMFIPDIYQFYWNTSAEDFLKRMADEYKKFWTPDRKAKAKALNLSQSEVSILASIVQAEQQLRKDERPIIAGLYLNRLRMGMRLESDPTLVFAHGDFSIKRVYNIHKEIESPYNTYKYAGLPPGPILIPEINSIDAVLNAAKHNYLFMCAKEDFSGYHNFARTLDEHNINAARYRKELNRRGIK
ncbi:MAG: endolytic transglycosylase MltG [Bacteroidia bacterium]